MNVARYACSSCPLAGFLYVFCGMGECSKYENSIERLPLVESTPTQKDQSWMLIYSAGMNPGFPPRYSAIACPLNFSQIVIMGGADSKG